MKIKLDENGFNELKEKIENLKINKSKIAKELYILTSKDFDVDRYNELKRLDHIISVRIRSMVEQLESAVIVEENDKKEEIVNIGDIITLRLFFDNVVDEDDYEVCTFADSDDSLLNKLSINSPLGSAVYKKKIGDIVFLIQGKEKTKVEIIRKNKVKTLELKK